MKLGTYVEVLNYVDDTVPPPALITASWAWSPWAMMFTPTVAITCVY